MYRCSGVSGGREHHCPDAGGYIGDTVAISFTQPLPVGELLAGAVTAANTVTATLVNLTDRDLDLPLGTLRADVWRH